MTSHYDVFNGDADGICALHQLRLASPIQSEFVTGVKRDIDLLQRVPTNAASVTVLDVSLDKNRNALNTLLDQSVPVQYFDHHFPGDIPESDFLTAHIDTDAAVCTGLLVNRWLNGAYPLWAITAAFGDNLLDAARQTAAPLGVSGEDLDALLELGTLMNYNGYGATLEDLLFTPDALYRKISQHTDPRDFIRDDPAFAVLQSGYAEDNEKARTLAPTIEEQHIAVFQLPDAAWARRISGVFANHLANQHPDRAHALLTEKPGGFLVSVRAPLNRRSGADAVCRQFESGGGRAAAAGINTLPPSRVDDFITCMRDAYAL